MHDIIAISNKVCHPDIFLTITCNPNWKEILNALLPGQTPRDRPDLCALVFKLKLQAMMYTVIDNKLFGTVVAHVRVIEFQKRGLPHAHVIFFLDERSKNDLRNPVNVNRVISAEIPPDSEGAELRELVLKHMIHIPCGGANTNAVCMGESGCKKFFPKKFLNATSQSEDDYYVQYRRRSPEGGGELVEREVTKGRRRQRVMLDNSWVVPHNRKLLRMFACHINAELCVSRVRGIKYLVKYVCKGSDRVTMELIPLNQRYDEIGMFQDASTCFDRTFGHSLESHTIAPGESSSRTTTWRPTTCCRRSKTLYSLWDATLLDLELPEPPTDLAPLLEHDDQSSHTVSSHANPGQFEQIVQTSLPKLNHQQKQAFNQVVASMRPGVTADNILHNTSNIPSSSAPATTRRVFFLDAPGGTGKTFLINGIQAFLELRDIRVVPVATSAVAAVLLIGGSTAHSTFKIPIRDLHHIFQLGSREDVTRSQPHYLG